MFDSYIAFHARIRPDAVAAITPRGAVTFSRLDTDIERMAAALATIVAGPDEAVSIALADPHVEWVVMLALARLGIATAPATDRAARQRIGDGSAGGDTLTLTPDAFERIVGTPRRRSAPVRRDSAALGRVLQSSGTTGARKRVGLSWRVIDAAIRNAHIAYGAPDGPWLASTGSDTILGFVVTLACWASGNPAVLGYDGPPTTERIALLRPRLIALVPVQLQRLLDALPPGFAAGPLRLVSGGGPVPPTLARRTRMLLTDDLRSVYGSSETGSVAVADLATLERRPAAAGYLLPNVSVAVVDERGRPMPAGAPGRLRIRSDRLADVPLDHEGRADAGAPGGWRASADVGRLGEDGLLFVDGRLDDVMNIGGNKILPGWIEEAALACPGVSDAAAFSIPDTQGLERGWLAVVTGPGFDAARLSEALREPLRHMGKVEVLPVNRVPRNEMGKVQRDRLRDLAASMGLARPSGADL